MEKTNDKVVSISTGSIFHGMLLVVLLLALYYLRDLVFVFLTSIVIASFVESGVKKLGARRVGRTFAVVIIYFLTLGILGSLMYFFVPVFISEISQFSVFLAKYLPDSSSVVSTTSSIPFSDLFASFQNITTSAGSGALQAGIAIFGGVFNFVLLVVLSFYLSVDKKGIETFLRIVSPASQSDYVVDLWRRTERKIGLWFQGQLLLALLVGVLIYLGLLVFGVQYALLLAAAAAVSELIPFGIILAAIPAVAAGFVSNGGTGALEVAGLFIIVQQFEVNLIAPLIVQKVVGISSLVVVLSLLVGLKLAGFWGVMLGIPVAVFLMEFLGDIKKKKGLSS
jgi:predicted PurR-regulated permease PerM